MNVIVPRSTSDLTRALFEALEKGSIVSAAATGVLQWLASEVLLLLALRRRGFYVESEHDLI